jgi:hypothetical protein
MEAFVIGLHAALDVTEIVLEGADSDREFVAENVKGPLLGPQFLNDLLPAGTDH